MVEAFVETYPKGLQIKVTDKCPFCGGHLEETGIKIEEYEKSSKSCYWLKETRNITTVDLCCRTCGTEIKFRYRDSHRRLEE